MNEFKNNFFPMETFLNEILNIPYTANSSHRNIAQYYSETQVFLDLVKTLL